MCSQRAKERLQSGIGIPACLRIAAPTTAGLPAQPKSSSTQTIRITLNYSEKNFMRPLPNRACRPARFVHESRQKLDASNKNQTISNYNKVFFFIFSTVPRVAPGKATDSRQLTNDKSGGVPAKCANGPGFGYEVKKIKLI